MSYFIYLSILSFFFNCTLPWLLFLITPFPQNYIALAIYYCSVSSFIIWTNYPSFRLCFAFVIFWFDYFVSLKCFVQLIHLCSVLIFEASFGSAIWEKMHCVNGHLFQQHCPIWEMGSAHAKAALEVDVFCGKWRFL